MTNQPGIWRRQPWAAVILSLCVVVLVPSSAWAKKGKPGGNQQQGPAEPPSNNPQILAANAKVQAAEKALTAVVTKFKAKYEATPEWTKAAADQKSAQTALNAEHTTVLKKLADSDAYKSAIARKEKASEDLKAARDPNNGDSDPQTTADLAAAVMQAAQDKSKLETDALANDSAYADDQSALDTANKALADLKSQEESAMEQDPDWQTAHKTLLAAQANYDSLIGQG